MFFVSKQMELSVGERFLFLLKAMLRRKN